MIEPFVSDVNLTPTSTAILSPESITTGMAKSKIVSLGTTELDAADAALVPTALVADTVNVYPLPFVNPGTTADVADPLVTWIGLCAVEPRYGVTVYPVIGLPLAPGAVQLT